MNEHERAALSSLSRFDWAPTGDDVWGPLEAHVPALHGQDADAVLDGFSEAKASRGGSPLGVALLGPAGAGKTHLLRWVRHQVQARGGFFFLVELKQGQYFWENTVHAMLMDLRRPGLDGDDQLTILMRGLCEFAAVDPDVRAEVTGTQSLTKEGLDKFTAALWQADRRLGQECRHTARALAMLNADFPAPDIGEAYLTSQDEIEPGEWSTWGLRSRIQSSHQVCHELSRLLAVTGPTLLAIDQIDTLIAQSASGADLRLRTDRNSIANGQADTQSAIPEQDFLIEEIGNGLMDARQAMHRTLVVVACFNSTWELIRQRAVASVTDRFRPDRRLAALPSPEVGKQLVAEHFHSRFAKAGFLPPYPTWPVSPEAFADAQQFTPRGLLRVVNSHVRNCLQDGVVRPLTRLQDARDETRPPELASLNVEPGALARLDEIFDSLIGQADTSAARDSLTEDVAMPLLLSAGLRAWKAEQRADEISYSLDLASGRSPTWHARLRRELDEATDDRIEWTFRSIAGPHHTNVGNRIKRVQLVSLNPTVSKSKAFVLQTGEWSTGPKTREKIRQFEDAGGVILAVSEADLSVFWALRNMLEGGDPDLLAWLRQRRPASRTELFVAAFGPPEPEQGSSLGDGIGPSGGGGHVTLTPHHRDDLASEALAPLSPSSGSAPATGTLSLGTVADFHGGSPMSSKLQVPLESLRKHVVIFAGSGSGKTVLLRRLIEECALRGVSSIVLDPNNDLARLGDAWPKSPAGWDDGDVAKASDYIAATDVVVWTPRREAGRPVSFQPLPDFAAVFDDPDEFALALDSGVAALAPRARVAGNTAKAELGRAVLRESLVYFARRQASGLAAFVDLLGDLPDDVTTLAKAQVIAQDMSQTLSAAMINDPMFGRSGVPLDPGELLTPTPGRRARVSVISFVGLADDEQRQGFVNQLQMALFAWVKRHPAGDRPLGGLLVMDEAQTLAPSGATTACTESTLALASQARKYGLGLIFATQAPKGIHNRIVGNAATQFYGFLNSPVQIAAAKEIASAKASVILDISQLSAGQFYAVGEGLPFQKLVTPMCLSHHPSSALTTEEVLARARGIN